MTCDTNDRCRVAFFLPNLEGGGAERSIVALANNISKLGVVVDLVLANAVGPYLAEVLPAVRIVDLSSKGRVHATLCLMFYLVRVRPHVIMSSLDMANVQLVAAAKLTFFRGVLAIGQRATIGPVYAHIGALKRAVYGVAMRVTYPRASIVVCNSHASAAEIRALLGVRHERVITIHNSVDAVQIDRLAGEPLTDAWFNKSSTPLILSVGSLTYLKDRATLVRAFALVRAKRDVRLAIVGADYDAAERSKVEKLVSELGLSGHVHLPGFDPNPYKWMRRAAVLVSSSLTEGCPNQVLEALALGTPVVATDCPGDTAALLDHGKWGRLVAVADAEQMAAAILATLDDSTPPDGRLRAADFAPSKVTADYLRALLPTAWAKLLALRWT